MPYPQQPSQSRTNRFQMPIRRKNRPLPTATTNYSVLGQAAGAQPPGTPAPAVAPRGGHSVGGYYPPLPQGPAIAEMPWRREQQLPKNSDYSWVSPFITGTPGLGPTGIGPDLYKAYTAEDKKNVRDSFARIYGRAGVPEYQQPTPAPVVAQKAQPQPQIPADQSYQELPAPQMIQSPEFVTDPNPPLQALQSRFPQYTPEPTPGSAGPQTGNRPWMNDPGMQGQYTLGQQHRLPMSQPPAQELPQLPAAAPGSGQAGFPDLNETLSWIRGALGNESSASQAPTTPAGMAYNQEMDRRLEQNGYTARRERLDNLLASNKKKSLARLLRGNQVPNTYENGTERRRAMYERAGHPGSSRATIDPETGRVTIQGSMSDERLAELGVNPAIDPGGEFVSTNSGPATRDRTQMHKRQLANRRRLENKNMARRLGMSSQVDTDPALTGQPVADTQAHLDTQNSLMAMLKDELVGRNQQRLGFPGPASQSQSNTPAAEPQTVADGQPTPAQEREIKERRMGYRSSNPDMSAAEADKRAREDVLYDPTVKPDPAEMEAPEAKRIVESASPGLFDQIFPPRKDGEAFKKKSAIDRAKEAYRTGQLNPQQLEVVASMIWRNAKSGEKTSIDHIKHEIDGTIDRHLEAGRQYRQAYLNEKYGAQKGYDVKERPSTSGQFLQGLLDSLTGG